MKQCTKQKTNSVQQTHENRLTATETKDWEEDSSIYTQKGNNRKWAQLGKTRSKCRQSRQWDRSGSKTKHKTVKTSNCQNKTGCEKRRYINKPRGGLDRKHRGNKLSNKTKKRLENTQNIKISKQNCNTKRRT